MIQRIQTVWWLLSIAILASVIWIPLFDFGDTQRPPFIAIHNCHFLVGLTGAAILSTLAAIFLYKSRKRQVRIGYGICAVHILMYVAIGVHYRLDKGEHFLSWIALPVISLIFQILAIRAVKKDEALVKSMDRLR